MYSIKEDETDDLDSLTLEQLLERVDEAYAAADEATQRLYELVSEREQQRLGIRWSRCRDAHVTLSILLQQAKQRMKQSARQSQYHEALTQQAVVEAADHRGTIFWTLFMLAVIYFFVKWDMGK